MEVEEEEKDGCKEDEGDDEHPCSAISLHDLP